MKLFHDKGTRWTDVGRGVLLAMTFALVVALAISVPSTGALSQAVEGPGGGIDGEHYLGANPIPPGDYPEIELPDRAFGAPLSTSVDLSSELPPVGNQGSQSSCVCWAVGYYYKTWSESREHPSWDISQPEYQYSPSFLYNQINNGKDGGSSILSAFYVLEARGDTDLVEMPYNDNDYLTQPTPAQFEAAKPYRIPKDWGHLWFPMVDPPYDPPNPIEKAKVWLDSGQLLVTIVPIYLDFPGCGPNPPSPYYDYDETSAFYGGHALCVCGYDDNANPGGADPDHRGGFKVVNSWGPEWNGPSKGFVYLSYDFVKRYAYGAWAMNDNVPDGPVFSCIEPSSGYPGDTVTIKGKNFGRDRRESEVTFQEMQAEVLSWQNDEIKVKTPGVSGAGDVHVINWDGELSNGKSFTAPNSTWYLAEGSTAHGFDCHITIENPNCRDLNADVTFMKSDGTTHQEMVGLPKRSQVTLDPRGYVGDADFSTMVECVQGETIAVDRTMTWTGEDASPGGHSSIGVTAPASTWYLPEGSTNWGFECYLLLQNPGDEDAACTVTYMVEGEGPREFARSVPAHSRRTFDMASDIGGADASIKVDSDVPVIAERAMYRNSRREGHDSIGTIYPSCEYYLAEGSVGHGFDCYLLIQNPNDEEVDVEVRCMVEPGPANDLVILDSASGLPHALLLDSFTVPANSRKTYKAPFSFSDNMSFEIIGTRPIIAERAMYWTGAEGVEACHDSVGLAAPHTTFFLPDGQTSNGHETWTLVGNPNDTDVLVEISYLTPDGEDVVFVETIPAFYRKSYGMSEKVPDGRASIVVSSLSPGKRIIAERAMYWSGKGAGTCTIGGYSD